MSEYYFFNSHEPIKKQKNILFKKIEYHFERNKLHAILGKSGAGKSVFAKALSKNLKIKHTTNISNCIYVDNHISFPPHYRVKDVIDLFTKLKNVDKSDSDEIIRILELDNVLTNRISECSTGELKRLWISIECLKPPNVLILDEPTSNLSDVDVTCMMNLFSRLIQRNTNLTILCIVHQTSDEILQMFNTITLIHEKEVKLFGPRSMVMDILNTNNARDLLQHLVDSDISFTNETTGLKFVQQTIQKNDRLKFLSQFFPLLWFRFMSVRYNFGIAMMQILSVCIPIYIMFFNFNINTDESRHDALRIFALFLPTTIFGYNTEWVRSEKLFQEYTRKNKTITSVIFWLTEFIKDFTMMCVPLALLLSLLIHAQNISYISFTNTTMALVFVITGMQCLSFSLIILIENLDVLYIMQSIYFFISIGMNDIVISTRTDIGSIGYTRLIYDFMSGKNHINSIIFLTTMYFLFSFIVLPYMIRIYCFVSKRLFTNCTSTSNNYIFNIC